MVEQLSWSLDNSPTMTMMPFELVKFTVYGNRQNTFSMIAAEMERRGHSSWEIWNIVDSDNEIYCELIPIG
jgi:hypothetical protein